MCNFTLHSAHARIDAHFLIHRPVREKEHLRLKKSFDPSCRFQSDIVRLIPCSAAARDRTEKRYARTHTAFSAGECKKKTK
jgi:hypothetical protein